MAGNTDEGFDTDATETADPKTLLIAKALESAVSAVSASDLRLWGEPSEPKAESQQPTLAATLRFPPVS